MHTHSHKHTGHMVVIAAMVFGLAGLQTAGSPTAAASILMEPTVMDAVQKTVMELPSLNMHAAAEVLFQDPTGFTTAASDAFEDMIDIVAM